jgi:hypothetical protein
MRIKHTRAASRLRDVRRPEGRVRPQSTLRGKDVRRLPTPRQLCAGLLRIPRRRTRTTFGRGPKDASKRSARSRGLNATFTNRSSSFAWPGWKGFICRLWARSPSALTVGSRNPTSPGHLWRLRPASTRPPAPAGAHGHWHVRVVAAKSGATNTVASIAAAAGEGIFDIR